MFMFLSFIIVQIFVFFSISLGYGIWVQILGPITKQAVLDQPSLKANTAHTHPYPLLSFFLLLFFNFTIICDTRMSMQLKQW